MNKVFRNFYRSFYHRTGGFIPTAPLALNLFPGDFFQIKKGEILPLGNIFRNEIIDRDSAEIVNGIHLNPSHWDFSDGVRNAFYGRNAGQNALSSQFEFNRQVLAFDQAGSFLFKGNEPQSLRIDNWGELEQQLLVRLTTILFSFRELYLVTESAATSNWTLAVSGSDKGELELASDSESAGLQSIFGHTSSKTIQSKDIEYYHREVGRKPSFFRAKRLVVIPEKLEAVSSRLSDQQQNHSQWASAFFKSDFESDQALVPQLQNQSSANVLDFLKSGELNPDTALLYFRWADANLEDIEKLFVDCGN